MEITEHGHALYLHEALAELDSLRTPDAIAARLRELSIRGGHTAQDCPIHNYLVLRTGQATHRIWVSTFTAALTDGAGPDVEVEMSEPVRGFIAAHDDHWFADLCNAGHSDNVGAGGPA